MKIVLGLLMAACFLPTPYEVDSYTTQKCIAILSQGILFSSCLIAWAILNLRRTTHEK